MFYLSDCWALGIGRLEGPGLDNLDSEYSRRSPHGTNGANDNSVISESAFENSFFALLVCLFVFFMVFPPF